MRGVVKAGLRRVATGLRLFPEQTWVRADDTIYVDIPPTCQVGNLDMLYEAFLGRPETGTFVEIGAYDGISFSNTSCLAALGWRGIYVEPVPEFARKCAERNARHPRITVLQLAVGADEGSVEMIVGGPLSTTKQQLRDDYDSIRWADGSFGDDVRVTVPRTTLDRLLEEQGIEPGFDLLVIDVEGSELEVFSGFTLERWRPRMLIVEIVDLHPSLTRARRDYWNLYRELLGQDYVTVYKDSMNTVLIDSRRVDYGLD